MANYIKYGNVDVDLEAYLKAIADNAETYLASQPWSNKQKNRWRKAYSDIVSRGVTGASIATEGLSAGRWLINYGGENIPIEVMEDKDRRAYQDAAYFLKSQMESLSTSKQLTEQELPVFDNKTFTEGLTKLITNNLFGGASWNTQEHWNIKDERDSTGKRGTTNRAKLLAEQLELYRDSLKEGEYNFEGSPFKDLNDFKTRINEAVTALRTPDPNDDVDPLNKIGLKARDYLYDGLDDKYTDANGNEMTYRDYYKLLNLLEINLIDLAKQIGRGIGAAINGQLNSKKLYTSMLELALPSYLKSSPLSYLENGALSLAQKTLGDEQLSNAILNSLFHKGALTPEELGLIHGAFRIAENNGTLQSLNSNDLHLLSNIEGADKLKKLKGVEGFFYNPATKLVFRGNRPGVGEFSTDLSEFKNLPKEELEVTKGLIIANLTGIGLDIASIIDAEPISAAGLATAAATAREVGDAHSGFWDRLWDFGTGLLGAIPIAGDAILAAKTAKTLKTTLQSVDKYLRYFARGYSMMDLATESGPGTVKAVKKLTSGESLSLEDWTNLGSFVKDIAINGSLNRINRANRTALKLSGVEIQQSSNKFAEYARKRGYFKTKPAKNEFEEQTVLRLKDKEGKDVSVKIKNETKTKLEEEFKGKSNEEKIKIVKENNDIKEAAKAANIDLETVKSVNSTRFGSARNVWPIRKITGGNTKGNFETNLVFINKPRENNLSLYLENRKLLSFPKRWWQSLNEGSARYLENYGNINSYKYGLLPTQPEVKKPLNELNTESKRIENILFTPERKLRRETPVFRLEGTQIDESGKIIARGFTQAPYKSSDGVNHTIKYDDDYKTIFFDGKATKVSGQHEAKLLISKQIKAWEGITSKTQVQRLPKEQVDQILKLKKMGYFLKQGGKIDNDKKLLNIIRDVNI